MQLMVVLANRKHSQHTNLVGSADRFVLLLSDFAVYDVRPIAFLPCLALATLRLVNLKFVLRVPRTLTCEQPRSQTGN